MNSPQSAHRYHSHGLEIESDLVLPEFPKSSSNAQPKLTIHQSLHGQWPELRPSPHSTPSLQLSPNDWRLTLEGIGWFRATDGHRLEWDRWDDSVSDRDIRTFLTTSGLGALAIQRGELVLHGIALECNGEAIVLLGQPVIGKSTIAWLLLQHGWRLVSSEFVVVNTEGKVAPGIHQLKLWHNTAVAFDINWIELPLVRKGLKRYAIHPQEADCIAQEIPIRAIYMPRRRQKDLEETADGDTEVPNIQISRDYIQQFGLMMLRNNAYFPRYYRGMDAEVQLFKKASELVRIVPIRDLIVPDNLRKLSGSIEEILPILSGSAEMESNSNPEQEASN